MIGSGGITDSGLGPVKIDWSTEPSREPSVAGSPDHDQKLVLLNELRRNVANDWAMSFPRGPVMRQLLEWATAGYLIDDGVKKLVDA